MSFKHRKIDVVLAYGTGPDGLGEGEAVTLSGHRVSVSASIAGGASLSDANVRIFGMPLSRMNQLSTVGKLPTKFCRNTITILASDEAGNMARIFQGTILNAYADMTAAPDVAFNVTALGGLIEALLPVPPASYPGSVDAAAVLASLADQAGLFFENNGVSVILSRPYYPGAALAQIQACVEDAGINHLIHDKTLAIWPKGGSRGGLVPLISPEAGMVGYPSYSSTGIVVTTTFNPAIRFGALVQVESSLAPACGLWNVASLIHDIESEVPGGRWFSQMQLAARGLLVIPK